MSTIYIHIGQAKTASTSIQKLLAQNREKLSELGIIYPDILGPPSSHKLAWYFGFGNVKPDEDQRKNIRECLDSSLSEARNSNKSLVFSSEIFFFYQSKKSISALQNYLKGNDIRIICYIRRQDLYAESMYNQVIRFGKDLSLKKYALSTNLNWLRIIEDYANFFGSENIIVRPFEKQAFYKQNILYDFLKIIGINKYDSFAFPDNKLNESFSSEIIEIMRLLYKHRPKLEEHQGEKIDPLVTFFDRYTDKNSPIKPGKKQLDFVSRFMLLRKYRDSNREIALNYLENSDGKLFHERPHFNLGLPFARKMSKKRMIALSYDILFREYRDIMRLNKRISNLKKQISEKGSETNNP